MVLTLLLNPYVVQGAAAASKTIVTTPTQAQAEPAALRFDIARYVVDGATLIKQADFDNVVTPYIGKNKDFSHVQRALESIEALYAKRGYSAVRVQLPDQELEKGVVHFHVVESRFGKVEVIGNKHVSAANAQRALPAVKSGGIPRSQDVAKQLRLANENPARQLNVVLKAGERDDLVDANIEVADSKPGLWSLLANNSGTTETGLNRIGVAYRNANVRNTDQVANLQYLTSFGHPDRVTILGGGYKVPLYQSGNSMDFFGGYSNVNSVVGGLSNFQGGGLLFSGHYNLMLDRVDRFDPRVSFGLDWRDFRRIQMTVPVPVTMYKEIVTTPLSVTYAAQGKLDRSDIDFNVSYAHNVPIAGKGKSSDFAEYDQVNFTHPQSSYQILRYGGNYLYALPADCQLHVALNGQKSSNVLIQGEQMRLGGADGVRGFSEGSEGGESAMRLNLEGYLTGFKLGPGNARPLLFYDFGAAQPTDGNKVAISSYGVGIRASKGEQFSLRVDMAKILKAGNDPAQIKGNTRIHASLSVSF